MESKLEDMMFKDGWKLSIRSNGGKIYREWSKNGYTIDEEDIQEENIDGK